MKSSHQAKMKILAVDDDKFILQLLEGALEAVGFSQVETVSGPEHALALLNRTTGGYDCFLLDIQMPVMDGIELCATIREIPKYRKTPIVMLTAMSERDYIDRAFAAGATDYVTKPFDILELGTRMRLAERLHLEIKTTESTKNALDKMVDDLSGAQRYPLDEQVEIIDIDRFLSLNAFENYVATLGRGKYYASNIMALKVVNIRSINNLCTQRDFIYAITDFAEAISDVLAQGSGFLTYIGSGIFICIYNRALGEISEDFALNVQDRIAQMGLVTSDGSLMEVQIQCGSPASARFFSSPGSLDMINRALTSVGVPPVSAAPGGHIIQQNRFSA